MSAPRRSVDRSMRRAAKLIDSGVVVLMLHDGVYWAELLDQHEPSGEFAASSPSPSVAVSEAARKLRRAVLARAASPCEYARGRNEREARIVTGYPRTYALLTRLGHSALKAAQIVMDAERGDSHALQWIVAMFRRRRQS